jgi:hypothetical protein
MICIATTEKTHVWQIAEFSCQEVISLEYVHQDYMDTRYDEVLTEKILLCDQICS